MLHVMQCNSLNKMRVLDGLKVFILNFCVDRSLEKCLLVPLKSKELKSLLAYVLLVLGKLLWTNYDTIHLILKDPLVWFVVLCTEMGFWHEFSCCFMWI